MYHMHQFKIHNNESRASRFHLPKIKSLHKNRNKKHIFYALKSLSHSPNIGMKFKSQWEDEANVHDLLHQYFGTGGVIRHKKFKYLFSVKDIRIQPPSCKTHPGFNCDAFLIWIQEILMEEWIRRVEFP